jgi:MFS transporter, PCFT/HCP family, solute carrier family 46 (folate transporter), member 1
MLVRLGRRPVAALAIIGSTISMLIIAIVGWFPSVFPIYAVWASSSAILIGGGNAVIIATLLGILTDVVDEADR